MKKTVNIEVSEPQFIVTTDVAFTQVDSWFGHTRTDLKMDIIYPENAGKKYPCIVWICGGAWLSLDKSAHLAYLSGLARKGFVVAGVQYRTSNEAIYPAQLQDIKAGIRYLRAHADRYSIDGEFFGVMGESAGGYLASMAALVNDKSYDVGRYLDCTSKVQAACPWYPPTDVTKFSYSSIEEAAKSPESLMLGKNVVKNTDMALKASPVYYVTKEAPPFLIIHGKKDSTVPFSQGESLYDKLEKAGCDAVLLAVEDAEHSDIRFFQKAIWDEIISFFKAKLRR